MTCHSSSNHTRVKLKCDPMIDPHHSSALMEKRTETCRQELWWRPWRNTSNISYCLLPMSWSVCLLIVPPAKDGTTHSELGLPIPISNQENALQTFIQGNIREAFFLRFPLLKWLHLPSSWQKLASTGVLYLRSSVQSKAPLLPAMLEVETHFGRWHSKVLVNRVNS